MSKHGAEILHAGEEPIIADIVFIHGLGGDRKTTWQNNDVVWPRDLLSKEDSLRQVRIITWGYDAAAVNFFDKNSHASLFNHAQDMLVDIKNERVGVDSRPIFFVGHSLGGLVIKQALVQADQYRHSRKTHWRLAHIGTCTKGIIFIGTPHRGAEKADWLGTANRFPCYLGVFGDTKAVDALKLGSDALNLLRDDFTRLQENYRIYSARESSGILNVGKIVEDYSATLDISNEEAYNLPGDHRSMCKFSSKNENGYKRLLMSLN